MHDFIIHDILLLLSKVEDAVNRKTKKHQNWRAEFESEGCVGWILVEERDDLSVDVDAFNNLFL